MTKVHKDALIVSVQLNRFSQIVVPHVTTNQNKKSDKQVSERYEFPSSYCPSPLRVTFFLVSNIMD